MRISLQNLHFLIVDDDASNLAVERDLLRAYMANVYTASSGQETLRLLPELSVALTAILLDLKMSVMDGWELQRHIRSMPSYNQVPIIAVTAYATAKDRQEVLDAHFDGYIAKPFGPKQFVRQIIMCVSEFMTLNG